MDLKQILATLESGKWCSLRVITANEAKGTGGTVLEIPKARITRKGDRRKTGPLASSGPGTVANHHPNFTRNIFLAESGRVITIHPPLITHINNIAAV